MLAQSESGIHIKLYNLSWRWRPPNSPLCLLFAVWQSTPGIPPQCMQPCTQSRESRAASLLLCVHHSHHMMIISILCTSGSFHNSSIVSVMLSHALSSFHTDLTSPHSANKCFPDSGRNCIRNTYDPQSSLPFLLKYLWSLECCEHISTENALWARQSPPGASRVQFEQGLCDFVTAVEFEGHFGGFFSCCMNMFPPLQVYVPIVVLTLFFINQTKQRVSAKREQSSALE